MPRPLVSVLILTWNSKEVASAAVASALQQTISSVEVIVLDNASVDNTPQELAAEFGEQIELICFPHNYGYTGGYNRGLLLAHGEFLLLLNPDARLAPDFIEQALKAFEDEKVGIVSGRLMRADGTTVDSTGQFLARSRRTIDRGYGRPLDAASDRAGPILAACGAAAFYRRTMIDDIADDGTFFDEDFFAFHEDLEIGWRAWRAGWSARYVPAAVATHLRASGQQSRVGLTLKRSPSTIAHIIKNRWATSLRHDRLGAMLKDAPFLLGREIKILGGLALTRPSALRELVRHRSVLRRARAKGKSDRQREGVWGRWSRKVPRRGIWRPPRRGA